MTKSNFWFKFEWLAWLNDRDLGRCSLETQGFWVRCICLMEESETWLIEGTVAHIANLVGTSEAITKRCIDELRSTGAADIEICQYDVNVFSAKKSTRNAKCQDHVKVVSRRLLKRENLREYNKLQQRKTREKKNVISMSIPGQGFKGVKNDPKNANVNVMSRIPIYKESRASAHAEDILKNKTKNLREKELSEAESSKKPPPPRKDAPKLTRIPKPFELTPERWAWLAVHVPDLDDPNEAHANFVEHWTNAQPGKGEKIDWELTWQKGMRLAKKWQDEDKKYGSSSKSTRPDRRSDADILRDSASQIAAQYGGPGNA